MWFVDRGLSDGQISALFALWSLTAILTEVPTGALADRWSRRGAVVIAGILQASAYGVWILRPTFAGFAAGFVLWGLGGALASGAIEALLYDHLLAIGAEAHYVRIFSRMTAAGLAGQIPAALLAVAIFPIGGFTAAAVVSTGLCLAAALVATRLPRDPPPAVTDAEADGYLQTLRQGVAQLGRIRGLRSLVVAVACVEAIDAFEEYFPLLADSWSIPTNLNPLAVLVIVVAGAVGAGLAGRGAERLRPPALAVALAIAAGILMAADLWHRPAAIALVAGSYGIYSAVSTVMQGRLQHRISGPYRATVTSAVGFVTELAAFAVYAAWAMGRARLVAVLLIAVALMVARLGWNPDSSRRRAK